HLATLDFRLLFPSFRGIQVGRKPCPPMKSGLFYSWQISVRNYIKHNKHCAKYCGSRLYSTLRALRQAGPRIQITCFEGIGVFWHPFLGAVRFVVLTGGLCCAVTSGYFLATLRVARSPKRPGKPAHSKVCASHYRNARADIEVKLRHFFSHVGDHAADGNAGQTAFAPACASMTG